MHEIKGDLFEVAKDGYDAFCILTNGFIKASGELVMGKGCAKQAMTRWPELPAEIAYRIHKGGHVLHVLEFINGVDAPTPFLVAFPVKPVEDEDGVPGFCCDAKLEIIEQSALALAYEISERGWKKVLLPRPGVGNGRLEWADVHPVLHAVFLEWGVLDRVDIISFPGEE